MKSHVGGNGLIRDISQDKKQDNIATGDERVEVIDQEI